MRQASVWFVGIERCVLWNLLRQRRLACNRGFGKFEEIRGRRCREFGDGLELGGARERLLCGGAKCLDCGGRERDWQESFTFHLSPTERERPTCRRAEVWRWLRAACWRCLRKSCRSWRRASIFRRDSLW